MVNASDEWSMKRAPKWVQVIAQVGFPIAIASFLLISQRSDAKTVKDGFASLSAQIDVHAQMTREAIMRRDVSDAQELELLKELVRIDLVRCLHDSKGNTTLVDDCVGRAR